MTRMLSASVNSKIKKNIQVLNLKENVHLLEPTALLLNSEWPRSIAARLSSLEAGLSKENFPISFVLVSREDEKEHANVIGHSRSLILYSMDDACYVESVLIAKTERGKGYGRLIMEATEEYAKKNGLNWIFLRTNDQEDFYKKLGYQICQPFIFSESTSSSIQEKLKLLKLQHSETMEPRTRNIDEDLQNPCIGNHTLGTNPSPSSNSSCPPPPPIPAHQSYSSNKINRPYRFYMKKQLVNS